MSEPFAAFFASGRALDVALLVVAVEAALLLRRGDGRRGLPLPELLGLLLPGVFLMLALRCALTSADLRYTALWMTASFPAHLYDVWKRRRAAGAAR